MDLGCGTGRHTIYLAQNGYQVFAVDISETGIEVTRAKAEKLNLTNIEFAQLDMRNLSVDDNLMDAIMCVWTSGHGTFEDARKNLKEMYRILRLGEILVIDYVSREDENYGKGTEIEKNTFINNVEGEENIPHHYFAKEEIEELYSYTKYKYREYVAGNQKVYEITETTKVEIVVNGDNNKFYTHPKMPDGEYYIRVWLDNINLGKMSGVDYSSINDTLKGVILDNIKITVKGSIYDDIS